MHVNAPERPDRDGFETITSPKQVAEFLRKLQTRNNQISAQPAGFPETFTTSVLQVDAHNQRMMLDELVPTYGNKLLVPGTSIVLRGHSGGIRFVMKTEVSEADNENGIKFYWLPFPALLHYQQRRSAFRVRVGLGLNANARLSLESDGPELTTELFDLSAGGFCVMLPQDTVLDLQHGDRLASCKIELPRHGIITVDAEIRHVSDHPRFGCKLIGISFVNVAPDTIRQVQRCVTFLEREQMRKQPNTG